MPKTKQPLSAQEVMDAYDKLYLEDRMAVYLHAKANMEAEKERKGRELEALNKLGEKTSR